MNATEYDQQTVRLLKTAFILSIITVVYNIGEGVISTIFGYADDTLALFGFGVDSFVEVISGIGIGHMVWRMRRSPVNERDRFERRALYVTGGSFFLLAAGLVIGSVLRHHPGYKARHDHPGHRHIRRIDRDHVGALFIQIENRENSSIRPPS